MAEPQNDRERRVAIYWDLENVVLSQYGACHGKNAWGKRGDLSPEEVTRRLELAHVDLSAVLDFAATIGVATINRAYGDWSSSHLRQYDQDLLRHAVDLVQLFPLAGSKNGADIRMAIDVVEDLSAHQHVTDVLLVTGDSDFVSLVQRCRRHGRRVTAVGVRGSTSPYLTSACDLFRYYDRLAAKSGLSKARPVPVARSLLVSVDAPTRALVTTALTQLSQQSADGWVRRASVKPVLLRLDAAFDEADSEARNFTEFMEALSDLCDAKTGEHDVFYRLRPASPVAKQPRAAAVSRQA